MRFHDTIHAPYLTNIFDQYLSVCWHAVHLRPRFRREIVTSTGPMWYSPGAYVQYTSCLRNKNQQDALFYSQFISIINLYMFRAGLLLVIRRYYSVYASIVIYHAFMLNGCWQDRSGTPVVRTLPNTRTRLKSRQYVNTHSTSVVTNLCFIKRYYWRTPKWQWYET